jgi:thymidine phosphorylase
MTVALLTNMDQPLGCTVGNSLEVDEALACLAGEGPDDVWALTRELGTELLVAVGRARSRDEASDVLLSHVRSGRAMARFRAMVAAQGGDLDAARPAAPERHDVVAPRSAWVSGMQSELLGMALIELGGGRRQVTDTIDHAVGFEVPVRIGQRVAAGQTLVRIHARDKRIEHVIPLVEQAILLGEQPVEPPVLIAQRIAA